MLPAFLLVRSSSAMPMASIPDCRGAGSSRVRRIDDDSDPACGLIHSIGRNYHRFRARCRPFHPSVRTYDFGARKTFFIMRVDRMFTSFIALLFTKPFDCDRRCNLAACLSHRCNAG
jgi:hypothetical protein